MNLNRLFDLNLIFKSGSRGYLLCNSIRALGAFAGFLAAYLSIRYGSTSEYGYFLFAVSIIGFLPDFVSSLAVAEYLNCFTRSLNQSIANDKSHKQILEQYQEIFNWFWISCFVSLAFAVFIPAFHSLRGLSVLIGAAVFVYSKQHLTILSEKLRLSFPPFIGDFLLFVAPQSLVILLLYLLHFLQSGLSLDALQITLSSALPYSLVLFLASLNKDLKLYAKEDVYGPRKVAKLWSRLRSSSGSALVNQLSIATSLSYCSIRLPGLLLGFSSAQISSVAIYGIMQRIQYLISIPGYSFISWNSRSLASAVSKSSRRSVLSLGLGMLFASLVSPLVFWLVFVNYRPSVSWLFSKNGFGFEVSPFLLMVVLLATSLLVLQAFVINTLTASSKFRLLLRTQAIRLAVILAAFMVLAYVNKVSVGAIFSLEVISLLVSLSLVCLELIPRN